MIIRHPRWRRLAGAVLVTVCVVGTTGAGASSPDATPSPALGESTAAGTSAAALPEVAGWAELVAALDTLPGELLAQLPAHLRDDPLVQQEVARLALQALTLSATSALGGDGDYPVFLPAIGHLLNVGQPNADTLYRSAAITPGGVYRLRGQRGSLNMAVLAQMGSERGGSNGASEESNEGQSAGTRRHLDLNTLAVDESGHFDLLLSTERPEGYDGDWWPLHPRTHLLMLRLVSSDWGGEQEPTVAIERLDGPAAAGRPQAGELEQRLRTLPRATGAMAGMFIERVEQLRQEGYVNRLKVLEMDDTGGLLDGQFYYEGVYDLGDDEALIIAAEHPSRCQYRSVLLTNELYQTTDWINNHSSLNDAQAEVDPDGMLRVVVAARDPGVPNWLDTAGYPQGVVQGRWTHCDAQPIPEVVKVPVDEVRRHLPAETPAVTPEQRETSIRERRAAWQQRRHW